MVSYRGVEHRWKNEKLKRNTTYKFRVREVSFLIFKIVRVPKRFMSLS